MKIIGINEVNDFLNEYIKKAEREVDAGLKEGADLILKESIEITPRQTGQLINETDVIKNKKGYEVRYNADYAGIIHEDLERRHINGQAKFLETSTNKNGDKVIRNVADKVRKIK